MADSSDYRQAAIQTDFGMYPIPKSVQIVVQAAKRRSDGEFDMRTAAARYLSRYALIANAVAAKAYVRKSQPIMPEAKDVA